MAWGATDLTVAFGSTQALDRVSTECVPGEVLAVVSGRDPAGKIRPFRSEALTLPRSIIYSYHKWVNSV